MGKKPNTQHKPLPNFDNVNEVVSLYKQMKAVKDQLASQMLIRVKRLPDQRKIVPIELQYATIYRYRKNKMRRIGIQLPTVVPMYSPSGHTWQEHCRIVRRNRSFEVEVFYKVGYTTETKLLKEARICKRKIMLPESQYKANGVLNLKSMAFWKKNLYAKLSTTSEWKQYKELLKELSVPQLKEYKKKARESFIKIQNLKPAQKDTSNFVGIEIECASKLDASSLEDLIINKAVLLHKVVRVGSDGSIRTDEVYRHPIEFRLLIKQSEVAKVLPKFMALMKPYIKVNASCGLHVHLDMRNRGYGRSYERLYTTLPLLESMVPKTRRTNTYCRINNDKKEWERVDYDRVNPRYQALNPTSYGKFKTLEVRIHSATTNARKIINWIDLLTLIIDKKFEEGIKEPSRSISSLLAFFTKYQIPTHLRNYVVQRISKFGKAKNLTVPKELESVIPNNVTEHTTEQDEQDDTNLNEASA